MIQDGTRLYFDTACIAHNSRNAKLTGKVCLGVTVGHCSSENETIHAQVPIGSEPRWIFKRFIAWNAKSSQVTK